MSPEFGSTCAIFPIDAETLRYLEFSGRPREQIELVEAYAREQGLWHDESSERTTYSDTLELDLGDVVPSIAGPKRPQDRVALSDAREDFRRVLERLRPRLRRARRGLCRELSLERSAGQRQRPRGNDGGPSYAHERRGGWGAGS